MGENIENKFWFKHATTIIAIFTAFFTLAIFVIRGFWFFYNWGYYAAMDVDVSYIEVESMGVLYCALGYIGVAAILVISNYISYILWVKNGKLLTLLLLLAETIFFLMIVFISANMNLVDTIIDMVENNLYVDYWNLIWKTFVLILTFNLYGIYWGIVKSKLLNEQNEVSEGELDNRLKYNIKENIIILLLIVVVEGVVTYSIGMGDGGSKKDYKAIVEEVDIESSKDNKYVIRGESQTYRIYPILCENAENYVISYLYRDENKLKIESIHQNVIPKHGVETVYFENIYSADSVINAANADKQKVKTEETEQKTKENSIMLETLVGAIIGAIIGGGVTFLIEERKQKREKEQVESHSASILFYDLKSIEKYLAEERSSVNLRYSSEWQNMVSCCSFLSDKKVKYIYQIYDETYNYKDFYKQKQKKGKMFSKEEIPQYKGLKEIIFDTSKGYIDEKKYKLEYQELLEELEKHIVGKK